MTLGVRGAFGMAVLVAVMGCNRSASRPQGPDMLVPALPYLEGAAVEARAKALIKSTGDKELDDVVASWVTGCATRDLAVCADIVAKNGDDVVMRKIHDNDFVALNHNRTLVKLPSAVQAANTYLNDSAAKKCVTQSRAILYGGASLLSLAEGHADSPDSLFAMTMARKHFEMNATPEKALGMMYDALPGLEASLAGCLKSIQ